MSNDKIDFLYNEGLKNGAIGGKLVGAGGGGFLMFYANNTEKLKYFFNKNNIEEVEFKFDYERVKNYNAMKYTVIILAGGKGKRIKKLTVKKPKPLVKILNKPFIEYQIDLLRKQKVKKLIISIGYKGKEIIDFIKNKKYKDIDITFYKDGKKPLGTGGALKKIFKNIKGTFIILYGDSYLPISIKNIEKILLNQRRMHY